MRKPVALLATALLAFGLAACSGGEGQDGKAAAAPAGQAAGQGGQAVKAGATIRISQSSFGPIVTDEQGRTLYAFTKDTAGSSACGAGCLDTWPALTTGGEVKAGEGITASLVRKTQRAEGTAQAAYGEWPLYYYAGDANPGETNGQAVDGVWFVVKPDGKLVRTPGA
jgi:predicted lipoprotein with Yx(FWY)xxD motif